MWTNSRQYGDSGEIRRGGCSTSQASFFKILRTISRFRPHGACLERDVRAGMGKGLGLNLGFGCSSTEHHGDPRLVVGDGGVGRHSACSAVGGEETSPVAASAAKTAAEVVEISSDGECGEVVEETGTDRCDEKSVEVSEISNPRVGSLEETEEQMEPLEEQGGTEFGVKTKPSFWRVEDGGYLNMLVEAAKLVSGDDLAGEGGDEGEPEKETASAEGVRKEPSPAGDRDSVSGSPAEKRDEGWMRDLYGGVVLEDMSPVVRSKRGRSQALPHRFRDSVLEPWKPLSRPKPNPVVPTKRRSQSRSRSRR